MILIIHHSRDGSKYHFREIQKGSPFSINLTYLMRFWSKNSGYGPFSTKAHAYLMERCRWSPEKWPKIKVSQKPSYDIPIDAKFHADFKNVYLSPYKRCNAIVTTASFILILNFSLLTCYCYYGSASLKWHFYLFLFSLSGIFGQ